MGIEENDNGQGNGSMVNWGLRFMEMGNRMHTNGVPCSPTCPHFYPHYPYSLLEIDAPVSRLSPPLRCEYRSALFGL